MGLPTSRFYCAWEGMSATEEAAGASGRAHPAGRLEVPATSTERSRLARQAREGQAVQLAPGIYAVGAAMPAERVARHHLYEIVARVWPGAVICDRSALAGAQVTRGYLFICHPEPPRTSKLELPGVTIVPRVGPGPLPGDLQLTQGLHVSGPVRQLVENMPTRGRPGNPPRTARIQQLDRKIHEAARSGEPGRIQSMLQDLDVISGSFAPASVEKVRKRLAALLDPD